MRQRDKRSARAVVHLSAAMGARFVHDAEAGGSAVCVADPRAARVLQRALLRVLSRKGTPCLVRVSDEVAAALSGARVHASGSGRYHLAVGQGRQGRSAFLLRVLPDPGDVVARRRQETQMLDELQDYLRRGPPLEAEEPAEGAACLEDG
jgi:hypothetical protein